MTWHLTCSITDTTTTITITITTTTTTTTADTITATTTTNWIGVKVSSVNDKTNHRRVYKLINTYIDRVMKKVYNVSSSKFKHTFFFLYFKWILLYLVCVIKIDKLLPFVYNNKTVALLRQKLCILQRAKQLLVGSAKVPALRWMPKKLACQSSFVAPHFLPISINTKHYLTCYHVPSFICIRPLTFPTPTLYCGGPIVPRPLFLISMSCHVYRTCEHCQAIGWGDTPRIFFLTLIYLICIHTNQLTILVLPKVKGIRIYLENTQACQLMMNDKYFTHRDAKTQWTLKTYIYMVLMVCYD